MLLTPYPQQVWLLPPAAARDVLGPEKLFGFALQALGVNGARSRIRGADLALDLFVERHAVNEMRAHRIERREISRLRAGETGRSSARNDRLVKAHEARTGD